MSPCCSAQDLVVTMATLGETLSDADAARMLAEADRDGDRRVDFSGQCACVDR